MEVKDYYRTKRLPNGRWAVVNDKTGKMEPHHYRTSVEAQKAANMLNQGRGEEV